MGSTTAPSPDTISDSEFHDILARYPACVADISAAKRVKPGQETLASLDQYRYGAALDAFGSDTPNVPMELDDVRKLVEWKLQHGKFRPTLMKLVSSNEPGFVRETVQEAVAQYRAKSDASTALKILTQLKGIGPATASLLLATHNPNHVIFFADEAFHWLCCDGSKSPIKYNLKEYTELDKRVRAVTKRLGVKAVDVERVAFVLMRQPMTKTTASGSVRNPPTGSVADGTSQTQPAAKRKASALADAPVLEAPVRRSKRGKQAS